jgi:hypothetical protein
MTEEFSRLRDKKKPDENLMRTSIRQGISVLLTDLQSSLIGDFHWRSAGKSPNNHLLCVAVCPDVDVALQS